MARPTRTRTHRALAAVGAALLGGWGVAPALAAAPVPGGTQTVVPLPEPPPSARRGAPPADRQGVGGDAAARAWAEDAGRGPSRVAAAPTTTRGRAAVPAIDVPPGSQCPVGTARTGTLLTLGFEDGLPAGSHNLDGRWAVHAPGDAAAGTRTLTSSVASGGAPAHFSPAPLKAPTGRTYLSFDVRGTYKEKAAIFYVNDRAWSLTPRGPGQENVWYTTGALDVTEAVNESRSNTVELGFVNDPTYASMSGQSRFEVDDVQLYQCAPTASKTTGDYNGDGLADVVAVDDAGLLWLWRGTGGGRVDPVPVLAGTGWTSMAWIASTGDLDGDGRADLMARDTAGTLWYYRGDGVRSFSGRAAIGTGWQSMVSIVPMPDMTGDGVPELLGLTTSGDLYRYTLRPGPRITDKTLIGVQFHDFAQLLSTGDYTGDGTPDVLAIKRADHTMWGYWTRPGGTLQPRGTLLGTGWTMKHVSSPGDFDGNGFRDVIARNQSDTLVTYFVAAGRWAGTQVTATGWRYRLTG